VGKRLDHEEILRLFDDQEWLKEQVLDHYGRLERIVVYGVAVLIAIATLAVAVLAWVYGP
jgi:hypothetical protein